MGNWYSVFNSPTKILSFQFPHKNLVNPGAVLGSLIDNLDHDHQDDDDDENLDVLTSNKQTGRLAHRVMDW